MHINSYRARGCLSATELITLKNISQADIMEILITAKELKTMSRFGDHTRNINGKNIVNITKNSSLKARLAFEIATRSLNANPITLTFKGSRLEEMLTNNESIMVINRFGISATVVETDVWSDVEGIAKILDCPVINANEKSSPCQALATILTTWERLKRLDGLKVTVIGDVTNYGNSIIYGFSKCGADVTISAPEQAKPTAEFLDYLTQFGDSCYQSNPALALKNANVIFCYNHDFGNEYLLTNDVLAKYCPDAIYFQNIPLTRGKQAMGEVLDSKNSMIFNQGENVLHTLRSILYLLAK